MYINMAEMPKRIMGKGLTTKVIPTVCNLKNMLLKLRNLNGDYSKLKQWEKRSYQAYNIDDIKLDILRAPEESLTSIIKAHILTGDKTKFGASCVDIYLVGFVSEKCGVGKDIFAKYIFDNEITDKYNSVNAIWTVGKGDGVYLGILNSDGSIKDKNFMLTWINR